MNLLDVQPDQARNARKAQPGCIVHRFYRYPGFVQFAGSFISAVEWAMQLRKFFRIENLSGTDNHHRYSQPVKPVVRVCCPPPLYVEVEVPSNSNSL